MCTYSIADDIEDFVIKYYKVLQVYAYYNLNVLTFKEIHNLFAYV